MSNIIAIKGALYLLPINNPSAKPSFKKYFADFFGFSKNINDNKKKFKSQMSAI